MKTLRRMAFTAVLALAAGSVVAQPGPGAGPGPGASSPRGGGPGHRGAMAGRWGKDYTPGWSMMSPAERREHEAKIKSMASYDECKAYMDQHRQQMAERAKERHRAGPAQPRRDACAGFKR